MRRVFPALLLGAVVIGCGEPAPDKPIDPALNTVTMEVKGMT